MAVVYIIYSNSSNNYYIGSCVDFSERLIQHNTGCFTKSFTKRANDWESFLTFPNLDYKQARLIEKHIKKMKSKTYIKNLKQYPEMRIKLISKYK